MVVVVADSLEVVVVGVVDNLVVVVVVVFDIVDRIETQERQVNTPARQPGDDADQKTLLFPLETTEGNY